VGSQLPLQVLKPHYDAILFAYGASKDRELGIPGENASKNVLSARAFVGWYNGLPEYRDLAPDLTAGEHAVVVGQGNVALDVARILLTDVDALRKTDISEYALEELARSRVKRVRVVGRRGPMQVRAYTRNRYMPTILIYFIRPPSLSRNFESCFSSHLFHLNRSPRIYCHRKT
jgi:adrenodoxin-NADP+ reductase